jgi:hypothetical protein
MIDWIKTAQGVAAIVAAIFATLVGTYDKDAGTGAMHRADCCGGIRGWCSALS